MYGGIIIKVQPGYISAAGPNIIFAKCRAERVWYRAYTQTVVVDFSPSYTLFALFISCVVLLVKLGGGECYKGEGTHKV